MHTKLALLSTISILSISIAFADQYAAPYSNNSGNSNQEYTGGNSGNNNQQYAGNNSGNNNQQYTGNNSGNTSGQSMGGTSNRQSNNSHSNTSNSHSDMSVLAKGILEDLENEYLLDNKRVIREILANKQKDIVTSQKTVKLALFLASNYGFYYPMHSILIDPNLKHKPSKHEVNKLLSQAANGRMGTAKYLLGIPVPNPNDANKTITVPTETPLPDQHGVNKAFSTAACGGHLSIMDILIQHQKLPAPSQDSVDDAFFMAAGGGHLDVLKWLFTPHNGLPNNKSLPLPSQAGAKRALTWAAQNGHVNIIEYLFLPHENISLPDQRQINHALVTAVQNGERKVVEFLMTQHAGVPLPDQPGMIQAFKIAALKGRILTMKSFLTPRAGIPLLDKASITKIYGEIQKEEEEGKDSSYKKEALEFISKYLQTSITASATVSPVAQPAPVAPA